MDPLECGSLNTVKIGVAKLLEKLKENRAAHEADYNAACVKYHENLAKALKSKLKELKKANPGTVVSSDLRLPKPIQYLADYDKAILKLSMTVIQVVELSDSEFGQYVQDNWSWQTNFTNVTKAYTSSH